MYEPVCRVQDYTVIPQKFNPVIGPVNFVITMKFSATILPTISILSVAVANVFSDWPLAICLWKLGGSSIFRILFGALCLNVSNSFWAIALTYALESTKASTVRLLSSPIVEGLKVSGLLQVSQGCFHCEIVAGF